MNIINMISSYIPIFIYINFLIIIWNFLISFLNIYFKFLISYIALININKELEYLVKLAFYRI